MLDNLFGNLEEHQEELQEKLGGIELESSVMDQAIVVKANARREILDIKIDPEKIDPTDVEQLEDLLVNCLNDVIRMATEAESSESEKLISKIMPPGLGGLFGKDRKSTRRNSSHV